jgi:NADPH-dependent glutamate synthase beta subunit-like oxidoreductase/ferredoxin
LQHVAQYIGVPADTPNRPRSDHPVVKDAPLLSLDYNLCIGCTRCVRACSDLMGIHALGFVVDSHGRVEVGTVAPTLKESGCKFCMACAHVCPTGAIRDKDSVGKQSGLGHSAPCSAQCPAGIDVPWFLRFVAQGKYDDALAVLREKAPFPGALGRVCVHPCEAACRRGMINEPIAIRELERTASDQGADVWRNRAIQAPDTGRRVAIVGGGPAGLTAGYYLRKRGHGITVFEAHDKPGGMLRYAIPRFRLPEAIVEAEIRDILALGIEIKSGIRVGEHTDLKTLQQDYDAVFIATGAGGTTIPPVQGAGLPGVMDALGFLRDVALDSPVPLHDKVVVLGAGRAAVDAARTARRMGAAHVHMFCAETGHQTPWDDANVRAAEKDGVHVHHGWAPTKIVGDDEEVRGICFRKCLHESDEGGTGTASYDDQWTMGIEARSVIIGSGRSPDLRVIAETAVNTANGLIQVNARTQETNVPGVFAGGDVSARDETLIHAVAAGRRAAGAIDRYLGGSGHVEECLADRPTLNYYLGRDEEFAYQARREPQTKPIEHTSAGEENNLGFSNSDARAEAGRCLQCDLRHAMAQVKFPPEELLPFTRDTIEPVPECEGAFRLLDETKAVIVIRGTDNLRRGLMEHLGNERAAFFDYTPDPMFSQRESRLLQQHLQEYGEMPGGGAGEDDLFDDDML